jgi:chemotaxis protein methyltransferase WspC
MTASDHIHAGIRQFAQARLSLELASLTPGYLRRAIHQRMAACGMARPDDYYQWLQSHSNEQQELVECLVVPETWFFRDRDSFNLLKQWSQSHWLSPRAIRSIRLLSLACSTGEEPFSMAITMLEAGLRPDQFRIRAVDISRRALTRAAAAAYGQRSFREPMPFPRKRYFREEQARHVLNSPARDCVDFEHAMLPDPAGCPGDTNYEVIFCRNVMIYFNSPARSRMIKQIQNLLAPDGLVFVGPAEAGLLLTEGFVSTGEPRAFAFHAPRSKTAVTFAKPTPTLPSFPAATSRTKKRAEAPAEASPNLAEARRLADAGHLEDAVRTCEILIKTCGPSADAYCLMGILLDALSQDRQAETSYRKALYLEPHHVDALSHLAAFLAEHRGDSTEIRAMKQRCQRAKANAPAAPP